MTTVRERKSELLDALLETVDEHLERPSNERLIQCFRSVLKHAVALGRRIEKRRLTRHNKTFQRLVNAKQIVEVNDGADNYALYVDGKLLVEAYNSSIDYDGIVMSALSIEQRTVDFEWFDETEEWPESIEEVQWDTQSQEA